MSEFTEVILVRHGQTAWQAENRYAGVSNPDLTATGRAQALALADWARDDPPDALFTSPVPRAAETMVPVEAALRMTATVLDELREVDFGVAEGRTIDELAEDDPDMVQRFHRDPAQHPFPGAEAVSSAAERGVRAVDAVVESVAGRRALVVAHNTLIRLTLCALLGVPLSTYRTVFPRLDNATLTRLRVPIDRTAGAGLLSYNVEILPVHSSLR